jgi:ABC-type multidrug transport system fused ATPase/permease subunit
MKDKLVIIIAHRFSTIQNASQILVLDQGKLVDAGTPSSLARKKGVYAELLKYQIEGNQKLLAKYELH